MVKSKKDYGKYKGVGMILLFIAIGVFVAYLLVYSIMFISLENQNGNYDPIYIQSISYKLNIKSK